MEEERARKLAIVLHADVAGSTALVRANESVAHSRIRDTFQRLSEAVSARRGTAREVRGDALVAEFISASDAVEAALSFQADNSAYLQKLDDEIKPLVRVGIAMGEVIIADDTITGEAVVLAQRLEQLAEPGAVCIQGIARETVPERLPYAYKQLKNQSLKGFDKPIRVYVVSRTTGRATEKAQGAASPPLVSLELPDEPSIAVLPFVNMSGDAEQEFFSDGITEDIITALSRISGLLVVARNSTMVYKGRAIDIKQVGLEQGVRYVLEGSVRKAGNRVRITGQLVDCSTGHHTYAERFDRELDDIFAVQDEITRRITVELQVQLTSGEQARLWAGATDSVEAWERALRANELMGRHIREDNHEARRILEQALTLDSNYAMAWSTLGMTHWEDARWGWSDSQSTSLDLAEDAARRAESLDREYPDTFSLLGLTFLMRGRHGESIRMMEKSVSLAPNHATNVALYAMSLNLVGRPDESMRQMKRAMRLSPRYPTWYLVPFAVSHLLKGELSDAHKILSSAIELEPESNLPRIWLAAILIDLGQPDVAHDQARKILEVAPGFSVKAWSAGINFEDRRWNERLERNLVEATLPL